jgi:serine/threonine-protein kinase
VSTASPPRQSQITPGYRLDRYELLCPIAEGGMASVWIARLRGKRGFEKLVAIKTILPKFAEDPRFERMFLDEAALSAKIEHGNVAQVLDLGEEHDVLYIAMELVDGDSLSKLLRVVQKKNLAIPTGILLRVLADTCGGLHAAHELRGKEGDPLGVVHRDVSPQNILVSMQGVAKLIDFGIAKARDRVAEDTSDGLIKGKIHYMAPEQALGKQTDRRADVWAIGAILYAYLAGRPAFEGENQIATLHLLSSGRPPLPLPPSVHPAVNAVVRQAMMHSPDKRFQTAADMQAAIEAAMVEAHCVTTTSIVGAFVQEHMAERARRRKEGLELALSSAAQREALGQMVERSGATSATGQAGVPNPDPNASGQLQAIDGSYSALRRKSPSTSDARDTPSGTSSGTRSALASPVPPAGALPSRSSRSAMILAVGVVVASLIVVMALRRRGPDASVTSSGAAPPNPVVAAPPADPSPRAPSTATTESPAGSSAAWTESPATSESAVKVSAAAPPRTAPAKAWVAPTPKPSASAPPRRQRADDGF